MMRDAPICYYRLANLLDNSSPFLATLERLVSGDIPTSPLVCFLLFWPLEAVSCEVQFSRASLAVSLKDSKSASALSCRLCGESTASTNSVFLFSNLSKERGWAQRISGLLEVPVEEDTAPSQSAAGARRGYCRWQQAWQP